MINEDLRKWVKEKWVDIGAPDGKGGYKPCGRSKGEKRKGYPKCVPLSKARKMSKKEKKSAVQRKRAAESGGSKSKGRKPKMVKTLKEHIQELVEKKLCARGKAAAKRKFDVYPSAYANMYASAVCSGKVTPGGKKDKKKKTNESVIHEATKSVKAPDGFHWMKHGKSYKLMKHGGEFKSHKGASASAEFDIHERTENLLEKKSAAWTRKEGQNKEGGLNEKGRKAYERENPGSDLKAPVSKEQAKKSKGGKAAKRRKSFCARMGGMKRDHNIDCSKDPDKRICKALRKWDC
tara:strand:- start:2140 stop:3015 length:876 start_codon:yes stop_codon:yes gene_type:complete